MTNMYLLYKELISTNHIVLEHDLYHVLIESVNAAHYRLHLMHSIKSLDYRLPYFLTDKISEPWMWEIYNRLDLFFRLDNEKLNKFKDLLLDNFNNSKLDLKIRILTDSYFTWEQIKNVIDGDETLIRYVIRRNDVPSEFINNLINKHMKSINGNDNSFNIMRSLTYTSPSLKIEHFKILNDFFMENINVSGNHRGMVENLQNRIKFGAGRHN